MTANLKAKTDSSIRTIITLPSLLFAQITVSDQQYSVVERGPFYRVLQRTLSITNSTGVVSQQVQSYTELEDGMNYLSNGQWVEAQDLIEATSTGAEAIHGQMTANFSSDITSSGAITLSTATETFQSHPIGLFYFDSGSGKVAQLGSVQPSVGTLYPPNVIVFSNVLSGLRADLMLVWAKNGFEQNMVLKQNPPPPESFSMSSSTTTLQLWTAMDGFPTLQGQRSVTLNSGLIDHIFYFQSCWFPVGSAFAFGTAPLPPAGQAAQVRPIDPSTPGTIPVAKSLETIAGSTVLVEQVKFTDLLPLLSTLPQASLGPKAGRTVELANRGQFLPAVPISKTAHGPMQIASVPYSPKGVTLDYSPLGGTASSYTFNGTYLITNTFTITPNTATFSNNACIKFYTNAYLMLEGPATFPSSGAPVVFTSSDDNSYGTKITNSTANPYYCAKPAVWFYYQGTSSTMQDAVVRWAQQGVEYTVESGGPSQNLYSSVFQDCTTGVSVDIPGATLYLSGDTYCNVATAITVSAGSTYGSMTKDCGVVSVAMVNDPNRDKYDYDTNKNSQTECSFAVLDSTNIVAAFMNTHLSEYGLGSIQFPGILSPRMTSWAVSRNNGTNFTDNGPVPPISTITNGTTVITNGAADVMHGDAGDTTMAYDSVSNVIYLFVNTSRETTNCYGGRLWTSTNKGQSFNPVNMDVPGMDSHGNHLVSQEDKPMIKVNATNVYVAASGTVNGTGTMWAACSTNQGLNWNWFQAIETTVGGHGVDIAVVPDGTAYFFWLNGSGGTNVLRYAWFSTNHTWSSAATIGPQLNSTNANASANLLRFSGDTNTDHFFDNGFPRVAYANGNIYIVYADLPSPTSTTDRGDIFLIEAAVNWTNHTLSVTSGPRTVNNDRTQTDQWNPSIAANPAGTELFIGYYSRQNDPITNSWIMAYGAKAYITNGLSQATFESIPISPTSFLPMFPGTVATPNNVWTFDPVWPAAGVCLDTNAAYEGAYDGVNPCYPGYEANPLPLGTDNSDMHFCADDYTWSAADSNYFYFAWCDRTRTYQNTRSDADIKFAKIKQ